MYPAGLEAVIPANEPLQIHAFVRAATVIGPSINYLIISSDYLRCIFCSNKITLGD
jgi:hypothetical protein